MMVVSRKVPLRHSERRPRSGACLVGPADPNETLSVSVRVRRHADAPVLSRAVARGRAVLSKQQFATRFGAAERDLEQVAAFGRSFGFAVTERSVARRTVGLRGTAGHASRAFGVELGRYQAGEEMYRGYAGNVHVPDHLAAIVEAVFGLDDRRMAQRAGALMTAEDSFRGLTPPEVAALYDFPTGIDASGQTIGLIEFVESTDDPYRTTSGYQLSDIDAYFEALGLPPPNLTDVGVDGAVNPGILPPNPYVFPHMDASVTVDIDVAGSVAPGANIAVYFAPATEQGFIDAISTAVHDSDNTPSVLAVGSGWAEDGWSRAAIDAAGATFQEATQLGVTVLASSGDGGAAGFGLDGLAHVLYPASDPLVTSCGGTQIWDISGSSFNEATLNWTDDPGSPTGFIATGGGVSSLFDPPPWQAWAGVPPSVNDGQVGRGIPDVAGHVGFYDVVWNGARLLWGGTDAVPPLYAGLVALINADLGEPVGYLNPNLYTFAQGYAFNDINDGVDNSDGAPGYTSGPGWDACTGLGSINGSALLDCLRGVGLPPALAVLTRGTLHMAWKGMQFDDTIWWSSFDGTNWAPQQQVPGVLTSSGVSLAEFNGRLVMAWKGSFTDGTPFDERIWWTTFDGQRWARQRQVPHVWTSVGPQLAFFNGLLYMLWKGEYVDESIWWATFDGKRWSPQQAIPGVGTSVGAAAAAYQQSLYAAWKGIEGDPGLWWSSFDGSSWDPQRQIPDVGSSHGPSLAVFEGRLYGAWKGWFDDPGIYWSSFDGVSWLPQQQIPEVGTSVGPGLIGLEDGPLYAAWKGMYGDEGIYWSSYDGANWTPQQSVPNVGTSPDL
jgi:kumamolisin